MKATGGKEKDQGPHLLTLHLLQVAGEGGPLVLGRGTSLTERQAHELDARSTSRWRPFHVHPAVRRGGMLPAGVMPKRSTVLTGHLRDRYR